MSFSHQEAESGEVLLSVDQSAVASLWNVECYCIHRITTTRKLACEFVLNLKISVFALKLLQCLAMAFLQWKIITSASKGNTKCNLWRSFRLGFFSVL